MSRRIVVPFLAAAAMAAVGATSGHAQAPSGRTITVTEVNKGSSTGYVDSLKKGPSAGDSIALSYALAGGAGRLSATCTMTRNVKSGEPPLVCQGVYALKDGDIEVAGRLSPGPDHLAVIGGTGAYTGARGTMTSTESKTGSTDVFTLLG